MVTKTKAVETKKPKTVACGRCFRVVRRKDCGNTETGKLICSRCWRDEDLKVTKDGKSVDKKWYVLQVEPGKEATIRKEVRKQAHIHNLEPYVGRVFAPAALVDKILDKETELVEEGLADTPQQAKEDGNARLREVF